MNDLSHRLRTLIEQEMPDLIEFRRDLHAHPELKYEEHRTSQRVQEALNEVGIEFAGGLAGGTGVLALLPGHDDSRTVGLRADMDALPITEENECAYRSTNPGVMHACGHDGHTTVLLGAARVLRRLAHTAGTPTPLKGRGKGTQSRLAMRLGDPDPDPGLPGENVDVSTASPDSRVSPPGKPGAIGGQAGTMLPRPVKLFFQPAEEGGAGGKRMVEDGCLTDRVLGPAVTEMYGLHCWPLLPLGSVATRPGPLLAATDHFTVTIRGTMSHAASPHESHDPIVAAAQIITALQSIVSRNVDPLESMVISVTKVQSGTAYNVIPETAQFAGTLRTLTDAMRTLGRKRFYEVVENVAAAHRCTAEIVWEVGYPVTRNDPGAVERFFSVARAALGEERATVWPVPCMGGEDFAYYCNEVPSCFFLLGQQRSPDEPYPLVHTPRFDFNDDSIALGVEMFCRLALSR